MEPEMPAILPGLPNSVLTTIFNKVLKVSNPGQLVKLSLACRSLREAVVRAEGLWERLCVKQGWSQRQYLPRPLPPLEPGQLDPEEGGGGGGAGGPATAATATAPAATAAAQSLSDLDLHWYLYYARRMMLRRNVRRLFKLYERFMSRPGSMALCPGATPEDLAAVEQALGLRDGGGGGGGLPAEVWELYRHRNGQAPGAFVTFVDDMRLLGLHELAVEVAPGLPELQQRLAALGRPHSPQPQRPALAAAAAVPAAAGGGAAAEASGTAAAATTAVPPSAQSGGNLRAAQEPEPQADQAASGDTHAGGPGELESGARAQGHGGGAAAAGTGGADGGLALSPAGGQAPAGGSPQPDPQLPLPPPPPALLADDRVVAVAANASGSRRFVVALGTGHVYIARGLSFAFYAPGVAALLQKLLA